MANSTIESKKASFKPSNNYSFRLKKAQVDDLKKIFSLYDEKADGYIKITDVGSALRTANCLISELEISELRKELDPDNRGKIDLGTFFIVAARKLRDNAPNEKVSAAVRKIHTQTSLSGGEAGMIPVSVIASALQVRGGEPVDEEVLNKFLRYLPTNDTQQAEISKVIDLLLSNP